MRHANHELHFLTAELGFNGDMRSHGGLRAWSQQHLRRQHFLEKSIHFNRIAAIGGFAHEGSTFTHQFTSFTNPESKMAILIMFGQSNCI